MAVQNLRYVDYNSGPTNATLLWLREGVNNYTSGTGITKLGKKGNMFQKKKKTYRKKNTRDTDDVYSLTV